MNSREKYQINDLSEADQFSSLNIKVIKSILELNDPEFFQNLINQYIKRSEKVISDIENSVKKKKTTDTYNLANDLIGSSLYIGTEKVIATSIFIYDQARKRNISSLSKAVIKLKEAFRESKDALLELIESNTDVLSNN